MFSEQAAQRAHTLLSPPTANNATFARVPVETYTNSSQPFRLGERSFGRQYAHIYATRLIQMRPFLVSRAQQRWGKSRVWGSASMAAGHEPPVPWAPLSFIIKWPGQCTPFSSFPVSSLAISLAVKLFLAVKQVNPTFNFWVMLR